MPPIEETPAYVDTDALGRVIFNTTDDAVVDKQVSVLHNDNKLQH